MFQMGGIGPMQGQLMFFTDMLRKKLNMQLNVTKKNLSFVPSSGRSIKREEYLADDFSIADIATWPWVRRHRWAGVEIEKIF
ncbi:MAG: hypothetical protein Ct9H300mP28_32000 [Pseudomonadota bacterium]|nr:MAG: hypothetical protein Ct9H300mP28_32000 [Pseudomonadota bacterium]